MPYSAGAPSRAIVPLAIVPPISVVTSAFRPVGNAGRKNPPRKNPSEEIAAGLDFRRIGRKPGRLPVHRSGIPPFIYVAKVKVK
jgi:hypothetical protein